MKTWKKILCFALVVLLLVVAGLCIWQRDNLKAFFLYLSTDADTIAEQRDQLYQDQMKELEEELGGELPFVLPSKEQVDALLNGEKDSEQVKQEMGIPSQPAKPQGSSVTKEDLVNQCVSELYAYKAEVMGTLGGIKGSMMAQWTSLPAEQRTTSKKMELGMAALRQCYAYEVTVDSNVQACLNKYRGKLAAIGESTAAMDTLWQQYCAQKESEKAYYMGKYLN